ncbi:MAG: response regulator, partial [Desulfuromonadaceae bacterium]
MTDSKRSTVLVVDDTPDNLLLINGILCDRYNVKVATNGAKALRIARSDNPPDLILLDITMSGMDGYEVCRQLKCDPSTRDIPVIFLTARTEVEDEKRGLELGAADYITRPISPPIVIARVRTHLDLKAAADFLRDKNQFLK